MQAFEIYKRFSRGESYWRLILTSGKEVSELQYAHDLARGKRSVDWYQDIVGSGDSARIKELWLHTPAGDAALKITRPYTAYQFKQGVFSLVYGRSLNAQIIGRVDTPETGLGTAYIWDVTTQQLYKDETANVRSFGAWRPGVAPLGALNWDAIGLRGVVPSWE